MHLFCIQILCIDYTSISYIYNCNINQWCIISTVSWPDLYAYRAPVAREINALSNCENNELTPLTLHVPVTWLAMLNRD